MRLHEIDFVTPPPSSGSWISALDTATRAVLPAGSRPVRFTVPASDGDACRCEVGVLDGAPSDQASEPVFRFRRRAFTDHSRFNAVLLVPTGVGAEIGGHSGDAGPVARLLGAACDTLVTHPNVGNAADINEIPPNALYVEGSVICRLLMGTTTLGRVRANRILLLMESHTDPWFMDATINMASAARAAVGIDIAKVVLLERNFSMRSIYAPSGRASGVIEGLDVVHEAIRQHRHSCDAVAIASLIKVPSHYHEQYFADSIDAMVNPWGGVEAMLTHAVSLLHHLPAAHAPMMTSREVQTMAFGPVDPRKAAEPVSATYLFSLLKGLHASPRLLPAENAPRGEGFLSAEDIHALVIPDGCLGLPTLAALEQGIPVIAVRGNRNAMRNDLSRLPFPEGGLIVVENYLEAAGVLTALRAGVSLESVRRPIAPTRLAGFPASAA